MADHSAASARIRFRSVPLVTAGIGVEPHNEGLGELVGDLPGLPQERDGHADGPYLRTASCPVLMASAAMASKTSAPGPVRNS